MIIIINFADSCQGKVPQV